MKRFLLHLIMLLAPAFAGAKAIYVVSVGISNYRYIDRLYCPETDAKSVGDLYRTHTTHVSVLVGRQATHDNILATMNSVFSKATANDIVVFFFSGHGGPGGLCAYDTRSYGTMVRYTEIQRIMRRCKANNKQLFIDSCFSGGLRTEGSDGADHSVVSNLAGVMLFLSSRTNEKSIERRGSKNGMFTQYLLAGLKGGADANGDKIVCAKELFNFVSNRVSNASRGRQNPVMWGKFSDNMHIMNWNKVR